MFAKLTGQVAHKGGNWLILEINGVGYKVFMDSTSFKDEQKLALFIHHHIREDRSDLYGFLTIEELEFFELLLLVPGVGPKVAQAILAGAGTEKLGEALTRGETSVLETVGGVGKKLAQKIVVELRPRMSKGQFELSSLEAESEVVEALKALGYKQLEIGKVLRAMPAQLSDSSQKIRWCLKHMRN